MQILKLNCNFCCFLLMIIIAVGYLFGGCSYPGVINNDQQKEETMDNNDVTLRIKKPPIDQQIPIKIETATFALG